MIQVPCLIKLLLSNMCEFLPTSCGWSSAFKDKEDGELFIKTALGRPRR